MMSKPEDSPEKPMLRFGNEKKINYIYRCYRSGQALTGISKNADGGKRPARENCELKVGRSKPETMTQRSSLELEGFVEVMGRALPSGLATLAGDPRPWAGSDCFAGNSSCPGKTERHLIPLVKGRSFAGELHPENFTAWAA